MKVERLLPAPGVRVFCKSQDPTVKVHAYDLLLWWNTTWHCLTRAGFYGNNTFLLTSPNMDRDFEVRLYLFCTGGNCRSLRDLYHFYLLTRSANDLLYYNITMCWEGNVMTHIAFFFFVKYEFYWYIHCIIWYEYRWILYEFYIVLRYVAGQLNWIYVLFFHTLFPTVWFIYHIRFCTCWTCSTILPVVYASSIQNPCWIIDCIANFLRYNTFQHFISC